MPYTFLLVDLFDIRSVWSLCRDGYLLGEVSSAPPVQSRITVSQLTTMQVLVRNETSEKMRSLRGMCVLPSYAWRTPRGSHFVNTFGSDCFAIGWRRYISTQGHLHVVNAFKDDSKVLEFSDCDAQVL